MLYQDYLKKLKECPFCKVEKKEILKQNSFAYAILAKAPYTEDHLLIIPKKHAVSLSDIEFKEKIGIEKLMFDILKKIHKKYKNVSVLYREGNKFQIGKSIDHIHFHIIPNMQIGAYDIEFKDRKILNEEDYLKKCKKALKLVS